MEGAAVTGGVGGGRCHFSHYEFKVSDLTATRAGLIKPLVLGESPISAECRSVKTLQFGERPCVNTFVIGEVLRVHVKNEFWREGGFPILLAHNLPLQSNPHLHPLAAVQANPHLRPRIGNPNEMRSNRVIQALEALKFRVTDPEPGLPEEVHGVVIAALNEEAVASAAPANKGGTNSPWQFYIQGRNTFY